MQLRQLIIFGCISVLLAAAPAEKQKFSDDKTAEQDRIALESEIKTAEHDAIALISDARNFSPGHQEGVHQAIRFLGTIRSVEAVPVLAEHIEYYCDQDPDEVDSGEAIGLEFPASQALARIGYDAIPGLLTAAVKKDRTESYLNSVAEVVDWIYQNQNATSVLENFQIKAGIPNSPDIDRRLKTILSDYYGIRPDNKPTTRPAK